MLTDSDCFWQANWMILNTAVLCDEFHKIILSVVLFFINRITTFASMQSLVTAKLEDAVG